MITIVGGAGFIGTRLCHRLARDASRAFAIVDKASSRAFPEKSRLADVRSLPALMDAIDPGSVIINLAAEHRDDVQPRSLYHEVNVEGAVNVCEAARRKNVGTIIFTSSVAVYGFAPIGTDETGEIAPFNDYGRTKHEAELVYRRWQEEAPHERTLVIVRPTVVFGERNRGNVYNLLSQIASGRFVMVGDGKNRKSMAYVENVAAFLEHALSFEPGVHLFNYIDKPDLSMNELVGGVNRLLAKTERIRFRLPYLVGYLAGGCLDVVARVTGLRFPVSAIRVKKFCSNTVFDTSLARSGFAAPVPLADALARTVRHEFKESHPADDLFYTE